MMDGIGFYINSPLRMIVLILLIVLIGFILLLLYYRFNHFARKVHFPLNTFDSEDRNGPKEWENQMFELAASHKQVRLIHYNFVLDDYNQIAYKKLKKIRNRISNLSTDIISLIPAARWLFDNFQMMYREIKKVRTSGNSYAVLPILMNREYRGFPRIYVVAKKMTALSQGHLNEENISVMLNAYQKKIQLTDKEVWILPEMLGFCLLENIIEAAGEIIHIIDVKSRADEFVKEKLKVKQGVHDITTLFQKLDPQLQQDYSFHSHVVYLLKNMPLDELSIQRYLEYYFGATGRKLKPSTLFLEEGKIESLLETTIRALIVSLRDINETDEERFFEQYSYLEQILSMDPEGIYPNMDSESRGMYRGIIVKLSLKYRMGEELIAQQCLRIAQEGREDLVHSGHVGTYLLGNGYPILKSKIRNKPVAAGLKRKFNKKGFLYFTFLIIIFLALGLCLGIGIRYFARISGGYLYFIALLVTAPMLIGIAIEITNFIFTRINMVKKIPSLNYLHEIPDAARTFIVMPVIISSRKQGLEYMNRLQKHYLANPQNNLHFALLVDHEDSPDRYLPKDEEIENALIIRMNELNELYPAQHQRFALFFRHRLWNKSENCYMGWERKRGKLEEFNNLINGVEKDKTSFSDVFFDETLLGTFRYVITLDADTNLLRDNAAKLVGLIDHPLNRPILDEEKREVKEGYVIIQPSVRNHIVGKSGSRFAELFGGQTGLAHYGAVISDIYQDIFNEGIYIGKGIYDAKAFHTLLHNAIPENRVLSHDLLESCYARTAFSSTAKVMDTFPGNVISFAKREHRWIRGDWQLLPWLFIRKKINGRSLCLLAKWKIFDNLRRSFVPLSKTLFLLINLAFFDKAFFLWIPLIFFQDIFQMTVLIFAVLLQRFFRPKLSLVYKSFFGELQMMLERAFLEFVITPYRAYIATDAMIRTVYRLFISRKNLLRWNTAESVDVSIINTKKGYFLTMWSSLVPAAVLFILLLIKNISLLAELLCLIVIFLWGMAYYIAYSVSQPKEKHYNRENKEHNEFLLETARRTWQFFKVHSTKENNWLCPDNYQVASVEKVSDKTSPTNIGLQLLSILSARDFGFESVTSTVERIENLMDTIQKMVKWKGHLYNWYHIRTLEVLNPAYISTVDSGNYLGHLIALKHGLHEQIDTPVFTVQMIRELSKTLNSCSEKLGDSKKVMKHGWLEVHDRLIGDLIKDLSDIWEELNHNSIKPGQASDWCREAMGVIDDIVREASLYQIKEIKYTSCPTLRQIAEQENKHAILLINRIKTLEKQIDCILENADFKFLYQEKRMLFHIGFHMNSQDLDSGCYDLMASESALTSFIAIAKGDVPMKHWYKLGRPMTIVRGNPCFVSWSGTMFEYLMPNLVFKEYDNSVYAESSKAAVLQQLKYAKEMNIPWGISESQYYRFDLNSNYQYKAFGVPKIRLQPVRKNSLVTTPYATMLALDYSDEECLNNLYRLKELGVYGEYGFYEAVDFNVPNAADMTPYCIVKSYMAHHQGMILVSINNYLNHSIMRERFHSEVMVKATEVLLEEKRQSHLISVAKRGYTIKVGKPLFKEDLYNNRYVSNVTPENVVANYLSNHRYGVMITSDGDGFSRYDDRMLYRWRADIYADSGNYIYIKDLNSNQLWSSTFHPTRVLPDDYQAVFSPHQAEFFRRDGDVTTNTIVSLDPDHSIEIRKVSITNHSKEEKRFELTSYLEVVGDSHQAELSHPAFNKLFLESEFLEEHLIFLSKRRGKEKEKPYLVHMIRTGALLLRKAEYENDRKRFIGRNRTLEAPDAVVNSIAFSNQAGFCNDPIMSIRVEIAIAPGESQCISFLTGVCADKEEAFKVGEELQVCYRIDDILEKFRLQKEIELKYLEITRRQMNAFQDLIGPIFYPSAAYRGPDENIRRNFKNQSFLWRFGISGDNPIMLLRVDSIEEESIIRDVLKAYEYLRINRVLVDLIILIDAKHGYLQEVDDLINDMTSSLKIYHTVSERPSFFALHTYQMIPAEIDLLYTVARIVFSEKSGIYFKNIYDAMEDLSDD